MQNLKIEPFKDKDLSDILKLERECFKEPYSRELLLREVALPITRILVAREGKELSGYIFGWVVGPTAELNRIAVRRKSRGRGIGRALLKAFVERLRAEGVEELFLEVRESNFPAINLYKSFGFKEVGRRENYYSDEDAIVFKLNLLGGKDAPGREPESLCKGKVPPLQNS